MLGMGAIFIPSFVCINRVKNGIKSNIACHSNQFVHISIWRWWDKIALCVAFSFFASSPCACFIILLFWLWMWIVYLFTLPNAVNSIHTRCMQLNSHNIKCGILFAHIKPPIGPKENILKTTKPFVWFVNSYARTRQNVWLCQFNKLTNAIHIRTYKQQHTDTDTDTVTHMCITIKIAFQKHYFPFFWLSTRCALSLCVSCLCHVTKTVSVITVFFRSTPSEKKPHSNQT